MRSGTESSANSPSAASRAPEAGVRDAAIRSRRDTFRRTARPIPALSRTATALDAVGAAPASESRLGALVLCTAAVLHPADPGTGTMVLRPLAIAHRLSTDLAEVRDSLVWLDRAGLLRSSEAAGAMDADEVVVAGTWERVAAPGVASAVDWPTVVERLGGHPAALGVALAFAETTVAPGEQTPITVPQLVAGARYSDRTVKSALAHLVEVGVLVRGPKIGARGRYAFSEAALGLAPFPDELDDGPVSPHEDTPASVAAELAALRDEVGAIRELLTGEAMAARPNASRVRPRDPTAGDPVRGVALPESSPTAFLELHGTRIALPPGATLLLEADEAGRLWYRMGGIRLGPILP